MSARAERRAWAAAVRSLASERGLRYEAVGGLNPKAAPPALCPGGRNRLTGELVDGFWGASCDAREREYGGWLGRAVLPEAALVKSHMPDLARVVPRFDVESIEANPEEQLRKRVARRVQFESIDFNERFLATVPRDHDPVALRELFSPGFLTWVTAIDHEVGFGALDRQLYLIWGLRERSRSELELAHQAGAELFSRVRRELEEANVLTYPPGPWNAGVEPFPGSGPVAGAQSSG